MRVERRVNQFSFRLFICLFFFQGLDEVISTYASAPPDYVELKTIALQKAFDLPQEWYATAYQPKSADDLANDPARLCFWSKQPPAPSSCFSEQDASHHKVFGYQFVEILEMVSILNDAHPKPGVLFIAKFSGGGSGASRRISIWSYRPQDSKFINILPPVEISIEGEYVVFPRMNKLRGLFVTADSILNLEEGETHFSYHKFKITIYQLAPNGLFALKHRYITRKKYPSFDDSGPIDVIRHEYKKIVQVMRRK